MNNMDELKDFLFNFGTYMLILIVGYGFLSFCNWELNPKDWNGLSRFLGAIFTISAIRVFFDD